MKKTQVLIVGGGPSGMVSAICLANAGISSIVVERNKDISEHPKAHELNSRSIEIFKSIGIPLDELYSKASPFEDGSRILFCNSINEEFGRIDLLEDQERVNKYKRHLDADLPYLNISQTEVEKILLKHINHYKLIDLWQGCEWKSFSCQTETVSSIVVNLSSNEEVSVESDYILAADGAGSKCRKAVGIQMQGPDHIQDFVSAYFEMNLRNHISTPAKLYWILNPIAPGTFIAHDLDSRWVYMIPIFLKHQDKSQFDARFIEEKIKIALGKSSLDIKVKSIDFWRMSAQIADHYISDRMILVGDAAHRFPPTGGLGMNTGIADAHNIAWKLALVLKGLAGNSLLATYESERRPVAILNKNESESNYHKIFEVVEAFGLNRNGWQDLARLLGTAPIKWLPPFIKRKMSDLAASFASRKISQYHSNNSINAKVTKAIREQTAHFDRLGLDIGYIYEKGALIHDDSTVPTPENPVMDYIPIAMPGARFPHLTLQKDSQTISSHDLLSPTAFTLLLYGSVVKSRETADLPEQLQDVINIIDVGHMDIHPKSKNELLQMTGIQHGGAILIRPDGHVAWRITSSDSREHIKLSDVLKELLHINTNNSITN